MISLKTNLQKLSKNLAEKSKNAYKKIREFDEVIINLKKPSKTKKIFPAGDTAFGWCGFESLSGRDFFFQFSRAFLNV